MYQLVLCYCSVLNWICRKRKLQKCEFHQKYDLLFVFIDLPEVTSYIPWLSYMDLEHQLYVEV